MGHLLNTRTREYKIGETITGIWHHGEIWSAVNRLLQPWAIYTVTEKSMSGKLINKTQKTWLDIQKKCQALLWTFTHVYEVQSGMGWLVLRYTPGWSLENWTIH